MIATELALSQALQRLTEWSQKLAKHAGEAALEVDFKCGPLGKKTIPSSPSRGAEAELILRNFRGDLVEVKGAIEEVEQLLLDPRSPWNRGN